VKTDPLVPNSPSNSVSFGPALTQHTFEAQPLRPAGGAAPVFLGVLRDPTIHPPCEKTLSIVTLEGCTVRRTQPAWVAARPFTGGRQLRRVFRGRASTAEGEAAEAECALALAIPRGRPRRGHRWRGQTGRGLPVNGWRCRCRGAGPG